MPEALRLRITTRCAVGRPGRGRWWVRPETTLRLPSTLSAISRRGAGRRRACRRASASPRSAKRARHLVDGNRVGVIAPEGLDGSRTVSSGSSAVRCRRIPTRCRNAPIDSRWPGRGRQPKPFLRRDRGNPRESRWSKSSGALGAEQRERLPALDGERNVVHRSKRSVTLAQVVDGDHADLGLQESMPYAYAMDNRLER